jgi:cytochrome c556
MARLRNWGIAALAVLGVAGAASGVVAQDKTKIVKDRQAAMKALGADNKVIGDYAKGMKTKDDALKAVADLQANAAKMQTWFAAGTSSADLPNVSYAKPAIWTDKDKFAASIASLKALADNEANLVKTGTAEDVGKSVPKLGGQGCGGCHSAFREKLPG